MFVQGEPAVVLKVDSAGVGEGDGGGEAKANGAAAATYRYDVVFDDGQMQNGVSASDVTPRDHLERPLASVQASTAPATEVGANGCSSSAKGDDIGDGGDKDNGGNNNNNNNEDGSGSDSGSVVSVADESDGDTSDTSAASDTSMLFAQRMYTQVHDFKNGSLPNMRLFF